MDLLSKLLTETYYLFHYSLCEDAGGPKQKSRTCGQDYTIDEAFSAARALVQRDLVAMTLAAEEEGRTVPAASILETEFGYDLIVSGRVVSRYWIHPKRMLSV